MRRKALMVQRRRLLITQPEEVPRDNVVAREDMCPNFHHMATSVEMRSHYNFWGQDGEFKEFPYKKKILICQLCGRKVQARFFICHDGCCCTPLLPPHRRKRWWKSKKADRRRDRKNRERRNTIR
jgi:hypothetical protein